MVKQCLQEEQYKATGKVFFIGNTDVASLLSSDPRFSGVKVIDPHYGDNVVDLKWEKKLENLFIEHDPSLIISYLGDQEYSLQELADYYFLLDDTAATGCGVVHFDRQFTSRWDPQFQMPVYHCRGNISFATNVASVAPDIQKWA